MGIPRATEQPKEQNYQVTDYMYLTSGVQILCTLSIEHVQVVGLKKHAKCCLLVLALSNYVILTREKIPGSPHQPSLVPRFMEHKHGTIPVQGS